MSIDPKFVELTADVLKISLLNKRNIQYTQPDLYTTHNKTSLLYAWYIGLLSAGYVLCMFR